MDPETIASWIEIAKAIALPAVGAFAAYFAIKRDIAVMHEKIASHHERLNRLEDRCDASLRHIGGGA